MNWNGIELPGNPYYQDDAVIIYHADCRDILPLLSNDACPKCQGKGFYLEPELGGDFKRVDCRHPKIDLVLTDPPYGMNLHKDNRRNLIIGDDSYPTDLLPFFKVIARKSIFMFCRWRNLKEVEQPKSFIAMVKPNMTAGDLENEFGMAWEGILFYPMAEHKFNKRLPDVILCRRVPNNKTIHETQKPEYPIDLLIDACSTPSDIILDPFLGSGTIAYCAKKLNRKCIGIEIEEKYCEIAAKRCSQTVMKLEC